MIQIYSKDKTDFQQNGDSVLIPADCIIDAKLNGTWELQMEHPLDAEGKYKHIETGAVIAAPSFVSEKQLFRIYNTERTDSYITAYARPIFLDAQEECFLLDKRPRDKDGQGALDMLMEGSKYSGTSNIKDIHTAYYIRKNLIEAIAGGENNSFINLWGGEVLFDNYKIVVNKQIGADKGMKATFGRNIVGITENVNMDGVVTRIVPVAFNGYMLEGNEPWVDSPLIDAYPHQYIQEVRFKEVKLQEDCEEGEEGFADLASLREELVRQCNLMYENGYDKPACNYSISLVDLSQTEEYKDYVELEAISLGDFIECEYEPLGIATKARVIQLTYDCIRKCNSAVELGDFTYDYFAETRKKTAQINSVIDDNGNLIAERVQGVLDALTTQLKYQKTVAKKQDVRAILFEDTDPNSEMYGALSIGTQGFQIANKMLEDGSDWEWTTAFTANGGYADAIVAGILTDRLGKTFWNLDTGELVLSGGTDIGGMSVEEIVEAAEAASKAENAVASVNVMYALGDSTTTAPTSGWTANAPEWTEGKYMWQKTVTVYVNGNREESTATCISGATGQPGADGAKGDAGAQGVGVKAIVEQYYLSSSSSTPTGGSWSTTSPAWKQGYYIWTRSYITWTDNTTSTTTPVLANALNAVSQNAANASAVISDWCYNNDTTYINGGKVYAPELFSKTITVMGQGWVYPTEEDFNFIKDVLLGKITPTAAQIALYDFNGDGKISITDQTACKSLILGKASIDDYPNYKKQLSNITVTIDASNPDKIIRMTGTSSFGRTFERCFGLGAMKSNSVVCEGATVSGDVEIGGGLSVAGGAKVTGNSSVTGKLDVNGVLEVFNEIVSTCAHGGRIAYGGLYGSFWRNDGANLFLMFTNKEDPYGTWNGLRPLYFNFDSGNAHFGSDVYMDRTLSIGGHIQVGNNTIGTLEIQSGNAVALRSAYGNYGAIFLNDGDKMFYFLCTNKNNPYGDFNSLRPLYINMESGSVNFGHDVGIDGYLYANNYIVMANNSHYCVKHTSGSIESAITMGADNGMIFGGGISSYLQFGHPFYTGETHICSNGRINFLPGGSTSIGAVGVSLIKDDDRRMCIQPNVDDTCYLGNAIYRYSGVYLRESPDISSDRRLKDDIKALDEKYIRFIELLIPKSFYSISDDEETRKRRIGYVAQEVEEAALEAGLTLEDCNFIHKEQVEREDYTGIEYSLNYDDIAVIVHGKVRQQEEVIKAQDERINALESEVAELKELVSKLIAQ